MKIRFRRGILTSILVLLLVATGSIWAAGDWSARMTASSLGESLMSRVGESVSERVARQLQPAVSSISLVSDLLEKGVISLDEPEVLLDLLESQVEVLSVDRLYVGDERGRFFMVARQENGAHRRRVVLPEEDTQYWSWREAGGFLREEEAVSFDPRERGWYRLASTQGRGWTEVYRFQSDSQPGITTAASLSAPSSGCEPCVVGADVTLAELSAFLAELEVSENGRAFLLDGPGNLIAHPDPSLLAGANHSLIPAGETSDPLVRTAGLLLTSEEPREDDPGGEVGSSPLRAKSETASESWHVLLRPLAAGADMPSFSVGVAVPESDFLLTLYRTRFISALIAIASIGLGILCAVAFSRGISRPIVHLERSMRRVGSFDLDVDTHIDTVYVELHHMVEAFERMVGGLRSFARYVPRDLVRDLVATGTQAELGAEEREISMYFSDIAGFTSLCERMEAQEIVAQLGEYFEAVVGGIKSQGGTIDKFIGDAVMALWNAPRVNPQHALGAALGALEAMKEVEQLNERWLKEGLPTFPTRIGISTAKVVVGNVGSSHRLAYTALGDGVNLTARLEGANKHYSTSILASEQLVSRLPPSALVVQPIDVLVVMGKARNVRVYEIVGLPSEVAPARLEAAEMYAEAFERYLSRDFAGAADLFEEISRRLPGYRPAELLLARCRFLTGSPPEEDWDGSFVLDEK